MEIHEIKNRLSILAVLQHYGLKTNKHDMLRCPFHEDKEPSLKIYPHTNTFHCFGCGATGDVIEFIQLKEKCSKHEAILKAQSLITPDYPINHQIQKPMQATDREEKIQLLTKIFGYFRSSIYCSPPAKKYAQEERGITVYETEVGYNSAQFHHGQRKDPELINQCVKYGLLIPVQRKSRVGAENTYYVFGKNCIVFPLKDKQGQITGLYFRSITNNPGKKHYYLKDREGLYPHYLKPGIKKLNLVLPLLM